MDLILPTVLSAAGALLGAWAGALFALGRFRRERAFDRRVDWYEKTIGAARRVALAYGEVDRARKRPQGLEAALKLLASEGESFLELANGGFAYATRSGIEAIEDATAAFIPIQAATTAASKPLRLALGAGVVNSAGQAQTLFVVVTHVLTRDLRREFKMKQLEPSWWEWRRRRRRNQRRKQRRRISESLAQPRGPAVDSSPSSESDSVDTKSPPEEA